MVENFVSVFEHGGTLYRSKEVYTVKIVDGVYHLACEGREICYGRAPKHWTGADIMRNVANLRVQKVHSNR